MKQFFKAILLAVVVIAIGHLYLILIRDILVELLGWTSSVEMDQYIRYTYMLIVIVLFGNRAILSKNDV